MRDAAYEIYKNLNTYEDLCQLIDNGDTESLHLECKSPSDPKLNKDLQFHLAKCLSGFSNTSGGVILWGMATTKHPHSGLDVITDIVPIGNCQSFEKQIISRMPSLSNPPIFDFENKVIKEKDRDRKGVVVTYIPKSNGDPVQSLKDNLFYYRSGDGFSVAPFEMIKRLFMATKSPELCVDVDKKLCRLDNSNIWNIPIAIENKSNAIAEHVVISLLILNSDSCEKIFTHHFENASHLSMGK